MTRTAADWRIQLFGGFRVWRNEGQVVQLETRKAAHLLAYLAGHPHREHSREELMELLWPDEDPDVTRPRLRQVLTTLRRSLEEGGASDPLLLADRNTVRLDPDRVTTDVREFEDCIRRVFRHDSETEDGERLRRAVELYRGDLLPGHYEDWVLTRREQLKNSYLDALERWAEKLSGKGEFSPAVENARKAIGEDPIRESAHCALMRIYERAGRPAEGLRQYQELEQVLWKELRSLPSAEAQTLAERLRALASRVVTPLDPVPVPESPTLGTLPPAADPSPRSPELPSPASEPLAPTSSPVKGADFRVSSDRPTVSLTPFYGREDELGRLLDLLQPESLERGDSTGPPFAPQTSYSPLVTLVGAGGSGKTRLAMELVRRLYEPYRGNVWFVALAGVSDASRIGGAVAAELWPQGTGAKETPEGIREFLARQPSLLVLDNFEHLVGEGYAVVKQLLQTPGLKCLITSRQPLDLHEETLFEVGPLPVPAAEPSLEDLLANPSALLFLDRAMKVRPHFRIDESNVAAVHALCRKLEGIPLAIELAAAWSSSLTPAQLLERLSNRFDLLVSRRRDLEERHRSLLATLEWSCQRLDPELRRLFSRLSVFHGGWTLEAAEAVCGDPQALDHLEQLRQRSLFYTVFHGSEIRFQMLETLREYSESLLDGEDLSRIRRLHAAYYAGLAAEARRHLVGPDQLMWVERLESELDNLRAALHWFEAHPDEIDSGLAMAADLWIFWDVRSLHEEGTGFLERLVRQSRDPCSTPHARALLAAARLACSRGDHHRTRLLAWESLSMFRQSDDPSGLAYACFCYGDVLCTLSEYGQAGPYLEEGLTRFEALHDFHGKALTLDALARVAIKEGEGEKAIDLHEQSAVLHRIVGDKKSMAWSIFLQGTAAAGMGDRGLARERLLESMKLSRMLNDRMSLSQALTHLGYCEEGERDYAQAVSYFNEALEINQKIYNPIMAAHCLYMIHAMYQEWGKVDEAMRYRHEYDAYIARHGLPE